MTAFHID